MGCGSEGCPFGGQPFSFVNNKVQCVLCNNSPLTCCLCCSSAQDYRAAYRETASKLLGAAPQTAQQLAGFVERLEPDVLVGGKVRTCVLHGLVY